MTRDYYYPDHLESKRLITRFLNQDDFAIWVNFFKDKEAVELFPTFGLKTNEERTQHWLDKQLTRYREKTYGLQALLDKETNEFIGQCGLLKQEVDGVKELEVGYHVFKKHWGKGYAPEAAKLFIDFGFNNKLADSIISIIDIRNTNSQRVAEKNGLIREKQTCWSDADIYVYRLQKSEWKATATE